MTSPPEEIEIECPRCHAHFKSWHRASMNLQLDNFSDDYVREMSTAVCPACKQRITLDSLVVNADGEWTMTPVTRNTRSQLTGNVGLYYVCYRLSELGWNAMPTSRNARGVDILAYNEDCTRTIAIQVKTLSKRVPVPLGKSIDVLMGDYWIIVNDVGNSPRVFVMTPKEVQSRAHRGEKEGRVSYWLQPKAYETTEFEDQWARIGNP